MRPANFTLYQAALDAERAFTAAVVQQFDAARASEMRYRPSEFNELTRSMATLKELADIAWLKELREANSAQEVFDPNTLIRGNS